MSYIHENTDKCMAFKVNEISRNRLQYPEMCLENESITVDRKEWQTF